MHKNSIFSKPKLKYSELNKLEPVQKQIFSEKIEPKIEIKEETKTENYNNEFTKILEKVSSKMNIKIKTLMNYL